MVLIHEDNADDEDIEEDVDTSQPMPSFAELLGNCDIKRVDKDRNVIGNARPEDFEREVHTHKRIGTVAEMVKDMSRTEKMTWALDLKDRANEQYRSRNFKEAAKFYADALVAMDFGTTEEERRETQQQLQLPVCTNLAACFLEQGEYGRCIDICDRALEVDPDSVKSLYRRGVARFRRVEPDEAWVDFTKAKKLLDVQEKPDEDLRRRIGVYMSQIQAIRRRQKEIHGRMFKAEAGIDDNKADVKEGEEVEEPEVDDTDEAIDRALQSSVAQLSWGPCCCCRRRAPQGRPKTD